MSSRRLVLDVAERVGWTFVQGATATLLLAGFLGTEAWKAAVVGGVSAILSMVKGFAASRMGSPVSAATLPALEPVLAVVGTITGDVVTSTGQVIGGVTGAVEGLLDDDGGDVA